MDKPHASADSAHPQATPSAASLPPDFEGDNPAFDLSAHSVSIRDQEIRLGQFLKLANLVDTGGLVKELIAEGAVRVNGQLCTQRGKVLRDGDVASVVDTATGSVLGSARVAAGRSGGAPDSEDDLGEYFDEATATDGFDPEKWRNM